MFPHGRCFGGLRDRDLENAYRQVRNAALGQSIRSAVSFIEMAPP